MARKPAFEGSRFDNDKGVKEGSKKDLARDAKEKSKPPFKAAVKKAPGRGR